MTPAPRRVTAEPAQAPARTGSSPRRPWAGQIPERGSEKFVTARIRGPVAGRKGQLLRYQVRMERDLPFDLDAVAWQVQKTLSDGRSWVGTGHWRLQLVPSGQRADFTVLLATPKTTDKYCLPLNTGGRLSCQDGSRAVLNARRWAFGASTWGKDVAGYRTYLINHEVGHELGHGHQFCPRRGALAPVMVQQTKSLQGCRANAWPRR